MIIISQYSKVITSCLKANDIPATIIKMERNDTDQNKKESIKETDS